MALTRHPVNLDDGNLTVFLDRLGRTFATMDREYAGATGHYGFHCDGCADNCCRSRFYHHTYLEYLYLHAGFKKLDPQSQHEIQSRASEICRKTAKADEKGLDVRLWCPLNEDGLCTLYSYRPMICRLHGIPYELQKPRQNVIHGPGCGTFYNRCSNINCYKFDRTPFYFKMAKLEGEFKKAAGITDKIKMTIAEMIMGKEHGA